MTDLDRDISAARRSLERLLRVKRESAVTPTKPAKLKGRHGRAPVPDWKIALAWEYAVDLTMRQVADELDIGPTVLFNYGITRQKALAVKDILDGFAASDHSEHIWYVLGKDKNEIRIGCRNKECDLAIAIAIATLAPGVIYPVECPAAGSN